MQGHEIPIDVKEKGLIWLLPPYCWPHRQIARKLNISASVVSKWRSELVEKGLLPENEKLSSVDGDEWTPERRFSVVLDTHRLAREQHPERWSKASLNWNYISEVYLNPEKEAA